MEADTIIKVNMETYQKSYEVDFIPSFNGGVATLFRNVESKVHVSFNGPLYDRHHSQNNSASIVVSISHDSGLPQAGASGKLTKAIQKSYVQHEDSLLADRIQQALVGVVQHSAYPRCTFSFCVHVLQKGVNLISTALCACMMCLLSAGVNCSTTLVPQTVILARQRTDGSEHADVTFSPTEKEMTRVLNDTSVAQIARATMVHDIHGENLLSLIFESDIASHERSTTNELSALNCNRDLEALAIMECAARKEIKGFVQWLKAVFFNQKLVAPDSCVPSAIDSFKSETI